MGSEKKSKQEINNIKRGKVANCIALHDFENPNPDLREWTEYMVSFFEKYGLVPNRISSPARTATKNINFKNGIRQLEKLDYKVDNIWFGALPPGDQWDLSDTLFTAGIYLGLLESCADLVFDNDIANFNAIEINELALELTKLTGAKYGYVYQREFSKGPIWYPYGVISGIDDEVEEELINDWGLFYRIDGKYKTGDLRDIYPINYLSSSHIERIIKGMRFEAWIKSDPDHGILEQLDDDLWSWQVPFDQISFVRESLRDTGMVLCI